MQDEADFGGYTSDKQATSREHCKDASRESLRGLPNSETCSDASYGDEGAQASRSG